MINPLQAMAQARAANQNRAGGIQSFGATSPQLSLQRQQLNIPNTGQRMDARGPTMVSQDPNFYADRKQARDFNAINAERGRQAIMQENQLKRDAQAKAAKLLEERTRQRQLDDRKANAEQLIKNQQSLNALADKRFDGTREALGESIGRHTRWFLQNGQSDFYQQSFEKLYNNAAMNTDDSIVQELYKQSLNGQQPAEPLKKMGADGQFNPVYLQYARQALESNTEQYTVMVEKAQQLAKAETSERAKQINGNYQTALGFMTKTGVSPMTINNLTAESLPAPNMGGLPVPEDMGAVVPPPTADTGNSLGAGSLVGAAVDAGSNALTAGANLISENPRTTAGVLATGVAADIATTKSDPAIKGKFQDVKQDLSKMNRKGETLVARNKRVVDNFKKLAKFSGSAVPAEADILKMKPKDMEKYVMDTRRGIISRIPNQLKGKFSGRIAKFLKVGGVATLGYELLNALKNADDKAALEATDELVNAYNEPSNTGTAGAVSWEVVQ